MDTPSRAVFLSYASEDSEVARHICEALGAGGIEVWFDQSTLRGGDACEAIHRLCRKFGVRRPAMFGSATRADFDPHRSDIDLAVEFAEVAGLSPARQYFDFKQALETLLGRPVNLVELSAMPDSRLKRAIVRSQVPLYGEVAEPASV